MFMLYPWRGMQLSWDVLRSAERGNFTTAKTHRLESCASQSSSLSFIFPSIQSGQRITSDFHCLLILIRLYSFSSIQAATKRLQFFISDSQEQDDNEPLESNCLHPDRQPSVLLHQRPAPVVLHPDQARPQSGGRSRRSSQ